MMSIMHSVAGIGQAAWDELSRDRPFQGYRWTGYGEHVMADCPAFYLTVDLDGLSRGRGTFQLMRKEPVPLSRLMRGLVRLVLQRWPLFLCRAPLANTSGLLLPAGPRREEVRRRLVQEAREEALRQNASFLVFDYIEEVDLNAPGWPKESTPITVADPGTILTVEWDSFDAYLASAGKKGRQHYKHCMKEAMQSGIRVERHASVPRIDEALDLIHGLERRYGSPSNPWMRTLLENMHMVESTFLEASIGKRLVGCGLLVYDQGTQLALGLGLIEDVPYVYFSLIYEGLREALEKKMKRLRWGSGAYDVKFRLGFQCETNNHARILPIQPFLRPLLRLAG